VSTYNLGYAYNPLNGNYSDTATTTVTSRDAKCVLVSNNCHPAIGDNGYSEVCRADYKSTTIPTLENPWKVHYDLMIYPTKQ